MKRLVVLLLCALMATVTSAAPISVLTYHNDIARTGRNTNETVLTLASVNSSNFGLLFTYPADGYVYAQPLVLPNVSIPGNGVHNVLYVGTEHDTLYAFDADSNTGANGGLLWQVSFINPSAGITSVSSDNIQCTDLVPEIGITSTPVIDPVGGTIYLVAKTAEVVSGVTNYVHRLHALDVATGAEKLGGPVTIQGVVPGTGYDADNFGNVTFASFLQHNRMALLLNNGLVYVGLGSHCDNDFYHGWLFTFNAQTLAAKGIFNSTPNGQMAGIWEDGCGPACDTSGNVYLSTGNGTFDSTTNNYGDSLLKFPPGNSLHVADYFTPHDQQDLFDNDEDLSSGGVVVLPDEVGSMAHPHLVVSAGKEGTIYLVDRDNMGQFNPTDDSQIVQSLVGAIGVSNALGGTFATPAYFNNTVYYLGVNDVIKAFTITGASIGSSPSSQGSTIFGFPGATPSISANGTTDGIVWAIQSDAFDTGGPSILHAFNAADVSQELYNSTQAGSRDVLGAAVKFSVPTVANGKVYVGTQTGLSVFGNFVTAPSISPNGGTFTNSVLVTLTNATPGAAIYYTLDNSTPTTSSILYSGPFSLASSATLNARSFLGSGAGSTTASANFTIIPAQPPSASFTGSPTTGLAPLTVTFTDSSTGTISNRSWTFGDGGTTNTLNTTMAHTYNSAGTNTVTLIVTGPTGVSTNTRVNYILVTNGPPHLVVFPGNRGFGLLPVGQSGTQTFSIANTGFQTLNGTATASGAPFALVGGSPFAVNVGQTGLVSATFSPVATGAFTGSIVFASNGGASTNAVTGSAAVPPTAGFTGTPTNGVATLLVNFTDASSGTVTGRLWAFGDGGTSALANPTHSYTTAGTFSVSLTVRGPLGSNTLLLANYITVTNVAPLAGFTGNPTNGMSPLLVNFTDASSGSITSRVWSFGDGGTSTLISPTHSYTNAGTFSVSLTVLGPLGSNILPRANYITVTNLPAPPVAGFTGTPTNGAATLLVSFVDASSGTVTSRLWAFGDGRTSTLTSPSYSYATAGTFSVSLTVLGPLGSNVLTLANYITVTNLVGAPLAAFIANPTNGPTPLLVNFTDASAGSITNHLWTFGDGNTSALASPSHTYSNAGIYPVALTVSGPGGSSSTNVANLITVTNNGNTPPTVTIVRPANSMLYPLVTNLTITLVASATANDGAAISKIEFFEDGTKLGETNSNPGTNFLLNPTPGIHVITARATDTLGATNTSAATTITVGARNSPLGNWEIAISGADKGAQFLTFKDDFSASGFGIRLKTFGLNDVSGRWSFNTKGQVTGPFLEQITGTTNWSGTLLATVKSLKSVNGTVPTSTLGTYHWKGTAAATFHDLSGGWTGSVTVAKATAQPVSYVLSPNANDFAVFDIATSADVDTVTGQLLVTSHNRVYGYLTIGGKSVTMSGSINVRKVITLDLNGTDNTGEKVKIQLMQ